MILRPLLLLVLLIASGCATQQPSETSTPSHESWAVMQQRLLQLSDWSFSGKLGVQQAQKAESAIISLWEQTGNAYRIKLSSSMLGLGQVDIQGNPNYLIYRESGEDDRYTDDPEALIEAQTGWALPVGNLRYWMRGLAAPGEVTNKTIDANGYPATFTQAGWLVLIGDFSAADNDPALLVPHRLTLQAADVKIKIVIKSWNRQDQNQNQGNATP